jgi:PTS system galactitol-specific IIC component
MIVTLLITNQTVAWTTQLAVSTGSAQAGSIVAAMDQGGCPITYIFTSLFTRENMLGLILAAAVYAVCMVFAVLHSRKRAAELEADEA